MPRLRPVASIGPVTAAAFLAAIDDAPRFRHAHQLEAYFGCGIGSRASWAGWCPSLTDYVTPPGGQGWGERAGGS